MEDGTSFCSNCNNKVEGMAADCPSCGKTFDKNQDASRCRSCGVPNLPGSISCLKCGKNLTTTITEKPEPEKTSPDEVTSPPPSSPAPTEVTSPPPSSPAPKESTTRTKDEEMKKKQAVEDARRRTQNLWELSEPFEKVIRSRRKRLAKINFLLERTKEKLTNVEKSQTPEDEVERKKLKIQIDEIMNEKEEIVNIEEGIAEMERIYRNLLALQETELQKKQSALQTRLQSFEEKIEEWTQERDGLKSKEQILTAKETELKKKLQEIEQRERGLLVREKELKDKMSDFRKEELDMMKMKLTGDSSSLKSQKGWVGKGEGSQAEVITVNSDGGPAPDQEEINRRLVELEEQVKKAINEREELKKTNQTITKDQNQVKRILKILDDLLEKLPDNEIKKFADSEDFKLYEKVLEKFEM
jgi:DNA repair exonuclease SbcCD ATPase subunit